MNSSSNGYRYFVTVQGEPAGYVESYEPEHEVRAWIAAGYKHPSITAADVELVRMYEDTHTARWLMLELT